MRKTILMLLLAGVSTGVAAEWVWVGKNRIGIVYADPASVRREGNTVTMWDLMQYKAIRTVNGKSYLSTQTRYEYDCEEGRSRLLEVSAHSGNMAGGETVYRDDRTRDWRPNLPDSGIEKLWKFACEKK